MRVLIPCLILLSAVGAPGFSAVAQEPAPAEGEATEAAARALADRVLEACGGSDGWWRTQHVAFDYLGMRTYFWDRYNDLLRIEVPRLQMTLFLERQTGVTRGYRAGRKLSGTALLQWTYEYEQAFLTDGDWILLPVRLHGDDCRLRALGPGENGLERLEVVFSKGGKRLAPPRYHLELAASGLPVAWAHYVDEQAETSLFTLPLERWRRRGGVLMPTLHGAQHRVRSLGCSEFPDDWWFRIEPMSLDDLAGLVVPPPPSPVAAGPLGGRLLSSARPG
ncbi:MAG: hypothetical protein AAF533_30555 [Acidobacteriota bacterium]